MDSTSVETLASHFNTKITNLKTCLMLRDSGNEDTCRHVLCSLQKDVHELEIIMALLRAEVQKEKDKLAHIEAVKTEVSALCDRLSYTENNLPPRLPKKIQSASHNHASEPATPLPLNTNSSHNTHPPVPGSAKKKAPSIYYPTLQYITTDEFTSVPKYIKGRLGYDTLNSAIDEINKSVAGKYKIMGQPRKALLKSDALQKKVTMYKQQDTKETKGLYFVTDNDFKSFSSLKSDPATRTILTLLRHCGRIREVRGGNLTRYVLI